MDLFKGNEENQIIKYLIWVVWTYLKMLKVTNLTVVTRVRRASVSATSVLGRHTHELDETVGVLGVQMANQCTVTAWTWCGVRPSRTIVVPKLVAAYELSHEIKKHVLVEWQRKNTTIITEWQKRKMPSHGRKD